MFSGMDEFTKKMGLTVTVVIYIFLITGAAGYIAIPWLADLLLYYFKYYVPTLIFMYVGGAAGFWLMIEFLLIMQSVKAGTPFIWRNVKSLRHIALSCAVASAAFLFMICFDPFVPFFICLVIMLFGMLCAIVLSCVFKQAVEYKQDSDLTI